MIRAAAPLDRLREGLPRGGEDRIISVYTEMYDDDFRLRHRIADGRLREISCEDPERAPVRVIGSISSGKPGEPPAGTRCLSR